MKKGILILTATSVHRQRFCPFRRQRRKAARPITENMQKSSAKRSTRPTRDYCREAGRASAVSIHRTGRRTVRQRTVGLGFVAERHRHSPSSGRSGRQGSQGDRRLRKGLRAQLPPLLRDRRLGARQYLDERRNPKSPKTLYKGKHAQALSGPACGLHRTAERR